ncbi:MAG TPA: carboxylate-amine ligase [Actinomycetota bacterium]|nr:carboxylate-amine ligase [Actinomycetota bacterium]
MEERWLTIGIEEEFQIVDRDGELRAAIDEILAETQSTDGLTEAIKADVMQSVVEIGTNICNDIGEARDELTRLRGALAGILSKHDLRLVSAGTHPFSKWYEQLVTDKERYKVLEEEMQDLTRELLIFGLHVHVGIPDDELRIEIMNEARYFLPHLLALSTSSPFWMGRRTGIKSYRSVLWSRFPRTGITPHFGSFSEYREFVDLLVKTKCIEDGSKIWWDMRAHHLYPTIEFRVCDAATRVEETLCLAALIQSVCGLLLRFRKRNLGWRQYMPRLIRENKWRAMRFGLDGSLIDFGKQEEVPERELALEFLDVLEDVPDELGCRKEVEHVRTIVEEGTSADRQLRVFEETRDLKAVVDHLAAETMDGVPAP